MSTRGKFITIEGQDGAGKSTNIAVIEKWLAERDIAFIKTREPGGTPFGEQVRELILGSKTDVIGQRAELLLMFASRAQHIEQVIEPALKAGKWVVCDRFTDATFAYQGGGRGESISDIEKLKSLVQGKLSADLTLLLDLPVEVGQSRASARGAPDRFEREEIAFKQRVRDAYLDLAKAEPARIKLIDASASMDKVQQKVIAVLDDMLTTSTP